MNDLDFNIECCRRRQRRLLDLIERQRLDFVIVQKTEHVQWLAGPRFAWLVEAAAVLSSDGRATLIAPETVAVAAAEDVITYPARRLATLRNDQREACSATLRERLAGRASGKRIGVEFSCCAPSLSQALGAELIDIEPDLYYLRRYKEQDELARLRKVIAATGKMYERARQIVAPGVNELEVFNQLQAVAVSELGEMLTGTGNDYACGEKGGPPRDRRAEDGELYILDLGPAFRGYFADNCRAIAVNGRPTDAQHAAWQRLAGIFPLVQAKVRPGVSCRQFFTEVKQYLDEFLPGSFDHHLGHGIGLFPHEAPHLNSQWDDHFEQGDVFTVEPGLYSPQLRAGIRLENDYLVTADGVECLSDFPLEL